MVQQKDRSNIGVLVAGVVLAMLTGCQPQAPNGDAAATNQPASPSGNTNCGERAAAVTFPNAQNLPKAFDSALLCSMAQDLAARTYDETKSFFQQQCKSTDELAQSFGGYGPARETLRNQVANGATDAQTKQNLLLLTMCGPGRDHDADNQTASTKMLSKRPIFSVGTFQWNGQQCPGYLSEYHLDGQLAPVIIYQLFAINQCKSFKMPEDNLFNPDSNPTGTYLANYLEGIGYSGAVPSTWTYEGTQYPTRQPRNQ
jgi:hypothetical protein